MMWEIVHEIKKLIKHNFITIIVEGKCGQHLKCTLKCALDMSCFEMDVYVELLKRSPISVDDLAEVLGKDKSTVYKALQNLLEKGFVKREYRILRGGGYKYLYKPVPFEEFRKEMMKSIDSWVKELVNFLDELEEIDKNRLVEMVSTEKI